MQVAQQQPRALRGVAIVRFDGIVFAKPCVTGEDVEAYLADTLTLESTPEALIGRLAENPFLSVGEPVSVTIGGAPGLQADLTSAIGTECDPPVTFLWELPFVGEFHLDDGESARVIAWTSAGRWWSCSSRHSPASTTRPSSRRP